MTVGMGYGACMALIWPSLAALPSDARLYCLQCSCHATRKGGGSSGLGDALKHRDYLNVSPSVSITGAGVGRGALHRSL